MKLNPLTVRTKINRTRFYLSCMMYVLNLQVTEFFSNSQRINKIIQSMKYLCVAIYRCHGYLRSIRAPIISFVRDALTPDCVVVCIQIIVTYRTNICMQIKYIRHSRRCI